MIIQCDRCSTKFRLDDSRVTGAGVRVKCTKCQNIFLVTPPEQMPVEEIVSVAPAEKPAKEKIKPKSPEGQNLTLDFSGSAEEPAKEDTATPAGKRADIFAGLDFSFSVDSGKGAPDAGQETASETSSETSKDGVTQQAGRPEPDTDWSESEGLKGGSKGQADDKGSSLSVDDSPFKDFDFGEPEPSEGQPDMPGTTSRGKDEDIYEIKRPSAPEEATKPAVRQGLVSASSQYTRQGVPLTEDDDMAKEAPEQALPSKGAKGTKEAFSKLLNESLGKDIKEKDVTSDEPEDEEDVLRFESDEDFEAPDTHEEISSGPLRRTGFRIPPAVIALMVFIVGGAIIYFSGVIDFMSRKLAPSDAPKAVEIEDVKVSYVENQNFGKFFLLEARLKNVTDSPQSVKRVTGTAYGKDGEKIMSLSVAPGRVVTPDDLKILPKEELQRQFKDPSGGTIPPKGTVPVMVIFTDVSAGVGEAGVEIAQ